MTKLIPALMTAALIGGAAAPAAAQATKEVLQLPGRQPNPTLSAVIKVGDMLYLSGQLGSVPGQGLAAGGVGPETKQSLENIKSILEAAGSSMERVVKCTVFLADVADFRAMNDVYRTFFPSDPPARSTVAVAGLVANARVEIECMALAGK
ncbi:MAG: RidA family protein [Gemmatimonadales bacterium]